MPGEKVKEQSSELFYVEVKEPAEIRKHILEVLKEILGVLQRFEKFKKIRHEKIGNIHKLRGLVKETNKLLSTLRLKLPQTNLRATVFKEPVHKKHHPKKKSKQETKAPKKEMSELERLEAELNAIESKLKSLT